MHNRAGPVPRVAIGSCAVRPAWHRHRGPLSVLGPPKPRQTWERSAVAWAVEHLHAVWPSRQGVQWQLNDQSMGRSGIGWGTRRLQDEV